MGFDFYPFTRSFYLFTQFPPKKYSQNEVGYLSGLFIQKKRAFPQFIKERLAFNLFKLHI